VFGAFFRSGDEHVQRVGPRGVDVEDNDEDGGEEGHTDGVEEDFPEDGLRKEHVGAVLLPVRVIIHPVEREQNVDVPQLLGEDDGASSVAISRHAELGDHVQGGTDVGRGGRADAEVVGVACAEVGRPGEEELLGLGVAVDFLGGGDRDVAGGLRLLLPDTAAAEPVGVFCGEAVAALRRVVVVVMGCCSLFLFWGLIDVWIIGIVRIKVIIFLSNQAAAAARIEGSVIFLIIFTAILRVLLVIIAAIL